MKRYISVATALLVSSMLWAQSEMNAYKYSKNDLKGTARYMSMGGAFGALGGDITTLSQNPAGIGVFRRSEIVTTMDISSIGTSARTNSYGTLNDNKTRFSFNNIGFVSSFNTGVNKGLVNYNFGFAYNRLNSFNRTYKAGYNNLSSSLTNYMATQLNRAGVPENDMIMTDKYDPYFSNTYIPWIGVLGYESNLIFNTGGTQYDGFFIPGKDQANADLWVNESGRVDEYTFNFGGNISNVFYFGASVGVMDMRFDQFTSYSEYIDYTLKNNIPGQAEFDMQNSFSTSGTGYNFKLGMIARPTSFLRLGFAFHTPTFYHMTDRYDANLWQKGLAYDIVNDKGESIGIENVESGTVYTPEGQYSRYNLNTPWKIIASTAFMLGKKGLISFDYEYTGYNHMRLSDDYGDLNDNEYIRNDFKAGHLFKIGGEYRFTSQISGRLGYANQLSPIKSTLLDQSIEVPTAGTRTQYTLDRGTQYYTAGIGYRFNVFFADLAYVYKHSSEDIYAFSPLFSNNVRLVSPQVATLKTNTHSVLLTLGLRF